MSGILCIQGGRVIDPINNKDEETSVFIKNGYFVENLSPEEKSEARIIDAKGLIVTPGFVDIHVHLREPGQTHKESIYTGSRSAAAGGFTTIACMPNTSPPVDTAGSVQHIKDIVTRDAIINVLPTGCITVGQKGEALAPIGSLKKAGVVAITDDGFCVQNHELMRRAMEYANMFDLVVMDHCQDYSLTEESVMHEGECSLKLGLKGWPAAAEDLIVNRDVILSHYTKARIHLQHITSGYSVDIIRRAKQRGIAVTAEVTPHHLALTDSHLSSYDTHFKMNPPLRTEEHRQALIEGLLDGTIDCISTDHAPHTDYEKDVEFDYAPFGIIGLETSLAVSLEILYHSGLATLPQVIGWLTYKPASMLGLEAGTLSPGKPADFCLIDLYEKWSLDKDRVVSRSQNSPWIGKTFLSRVKGTWVKGKQVYNGSEIVSQPKPQEPALV